MTVAEVTRGFVGEAVCNSCVKCVEKGGFPRDMNFKTLV